MQTYFAMFYETLFGFFALFVLAKVLGKTQISQLTAFDFISALILGELVGNALFDDEAGLPEIAFVITLWGVLLYLTEIITQKFKGTRHMLEGNPEIVIYQGKLIRDTMKKNNLDVNQLQNMLRSKDTFSIREVEYALLETDGTISVLKKPAYQIPTKQDMNVSQQEAHLSITLINDGEVIYDNLKEHNFTEKWLMDEIKKHGYEKIEDIFYAEYMKGKDLLVLPFVNRDHVKFDKDDN